MLNQFEDQAYSEFCNGAGSTLEAFANIMPGPAIAPPEQLAQLAGASCLPCIRITHALADACTLCNTRRAARAAIMGSTGCEPLRGNDLTAAFDLNGRSKWASLGYAALTFPVFCVLFYLGVRNVRHERR